MTEEEYIQGIFFDIGECFLNNSLYGDDCEEKVKSIIKQIIKDTKKACSSYVTNHIAMLPLSFNANLLIEGVQKAIKNAEVTGE